MGKSPLSGYRTGELAVSLKKETFLKHYWEQKKKLLNYYCRMIHPTGAHRYWKPMWTSCLQDIPMECNSESAVKTSNGAQPNISIRNGQDSINREPPNFMSIQVMVSWAILVGSVLHRRSPFLNWLKVNYTFSQPRILAK